QAAVDSANFYTAGVVEFRHENGIEGWRDNLAGYLEIIYSANASATDIIIFPEATLDNFNVFGFVPDGGQKVNPCLDDPEAKYYAEYLVAISCAARNASKYLVVNVPEHELCSVHPEDPRPCAPDGFNTYNTNVAFDRSGTVISRYRKIHLYGEPRNTTLLPEIVSFETDFGVTFGHMICFDIIFYTPAQTLIVEQGVRDFIFPTFWFSQLPFLTGNNHNLLDFTMPRTAVQVQQSWAFANDVNLLAAGASRPEGGNSGTGIYHGRDGSLSSEMALAEGQRRLHVAQVPKYARGATRWGRSRRWQAEAQGPRVSNTTGYKMKRDDMTRYNTVALESMLVQAGFSQLEYKVCHGRLCCHFALEWRKLNATANPAHYHTYRLGAYDGWRNEASVEQNYVRNCAIFACTGPNVEDCGKLVHDFQPRVAFTRLSINATYPKSQQLLLAPNSVLDTLLPLRPDQFEWSIDELPDQHQLQLRFALAEQLELENLLTFAIYGNYFDDDCTFGSGTEQQDLECGFKPKD
ncbi:hypothetical protein KR044_011590, partial [Drosophila immigrans]